MYNKTTVLIYKQLGINIVNYLYWNVKQNNETLLFKMSKNLIQIIQFILYLLITSKRKFTKFTHAWHNFHHTC